MDRAPDGYNIGVNIGDAAGQTVAHAHLHVIPRYLGDVDDPRGGIGGSSLRELDALVIDYASHEMAIEEKLWRVRERKGLPSDFW